MQEPTPILPCDSVVETWIQQRVPTRIVRVIPGVVRPRRNTVVGHCLDHVGILLPAAGIGFLKHHSPVVPEGWVDCPHVLGMLPNACRVAGVDIDAVVLGRLLRRHEPDHGAHIAQARLQGGDFTGRVRIALRPRHRLENVEITDEIQGQPLPPRGRQSSGIAGILGKGFDIYRLVQVEIPDRHKGQDHDNQDQEDQCLA